MTKNKQSFPNITEIKTDIKRLNRLIERCKSHLKKHKRHYELLKLTTHKDSLIAQKGFKTKHKNESWQ